MQDDHFAWGQFLTDATRAGVRFAVPQLSQSGAEGLIGGSSFMGGSFAGQVSNGGMSASSGIMRGNGTRGGSSFIDVGSGLLRSLGDSTDGSLRTTLHTLSSLTDSRSGYALTGIGTGMDFHVSGSMGNMMGGPGSGAGGIGGAGAHGQTGHGGGPSLSLKLKF